MYKQQAFSRIQELHKSKYKCLSVPEPHRKGEDVSGLRLAAGKRPASLLPTSSFPVWSYFLSCLSLPSGTCRLPESRAQSTETCTEQNVCVCPLGELICLTNSIERARCEEAGYLASHISYQSFLITFLAAVDHLTESCGAGRESGC